MRVGNYAAVPCSVGATNILARAAQANPPQCMWEGVNGIVAFEKIQVYHSYWKWFMGGHESPVPALFSRLLAQPAVELLEHRVTHDEYALVATGQARIRLQWHQESVAITITPSWAAGVSYTAFAFEIACYVANDLVDPLHGAGGEIEFIATHLAVTRDICRNEESWTSFRRTTDLLLGLADQAELITGAPVVARGPMAPYMAILGSLPGFEVVEVPGVSGGRASIRIGHVRFLLGLSHLSFWRYDFGNSSDAASLEEFVSSAHSSRKKVVRGLFGEVDFARNHIAEIDAVCSTPAAWREFREQVEARSIPE